MKNVIRLSPVLTFAVPFILMAQAVDKKATVKSPHQIYRSFNQGSLAPPVPGTGNVKKNSLAFPHHARQDEPMRFPYQDPAGLYFYSCPISLGSGQVLMVWMNLAGDTLFCATSSDAGRSWGSPVIVAVTAPGNFSLSGVRTSTGRLMTVWAGNEGLRASYSDKNGSAWAAPISLTANAADFAPVISRTIDGQLWLFYNRYVGVNSNIYFRTSSDNGSAWSAERTFVATSADEFDGMVVSGSGSTVQAFFVDDTDGNLNIFRRTSIDGGSTWSAKSRVISSVLSDFSPRVLRQSADTLWMTYERVEPSNIPGYFQQEIYYTKSTDGGTSWSPAVEFTRFAGNDGVHNADLMDDQPFISFASERWGASTFSAQIWYGIIGMTMDSNPPPDLLDVDATTTPDNLIIVRAVVDDETGIADVKISYTLSHNPNGPFQMYDDGQHDDGNAADNIWGITLGPFQLGDAILPTLAITDISANTVEISASPIKIKTVHNVGNLILSCGDDSQLAEGGASLGTSAHWPRANGQDYLFLGGLWVGANAGGKNRVMNRDYFDFDWNGTPGTAYTLAPGLSNQDGTATYDDQSAFSAPIGLRVHQQSYQWSAATRDDFIIFKYTIRNLGSNGGLNEVFVSPWLDPDVTLQSNPGNDRVGYDDQRNMIYVYDSQNSPRGYLGLKLLGAGIRAHTINAYGGNIDPLNDQSRFQYLTNGAITVPAGTNDYRLLLTAPPFSLAAGDSATVAYGIVMGNGLTELRAHADTLEAIYRGIFTAVAETPSGQVPARYSLAQNYPNPFNPSTTITFAIPRKSFVTLKVYDLFGKEVATLVEKYLAPGFHQVDWQAGEFASGVYFYRIQANDPATGAGLGYAETRKLVLVK